MSDDPWLEDEEDPRAAERQARRDDLLRRKKIRHRRMALAGVITVVVLGGAGTAVATLTGTRHVTVTQIITGPPTTASIKGSPAGTGSGTGTGASSTAIRSSTTAASTTKTGTTASGTTTTGSAPAPALKSGSTAAFNSFKATQPGPVSVALEPLGDNQVTTLGGDADAHAWSTSKVPVLMALIKARGGSSQLTASERAEAQKAITESDNQSILDLFADLKKLKGGLNGASDFVTQNALRAGGDQTTSIATAPPPPGAATTFGQTEWSPSNSVRFFSALGRGCFGSTDSLYVLHLMEHISSSESWGLGSAGFSQIAFKGGWGPEGGSYLVRQSGIIDPGSRSGVAVSIVAHPPAGGNSFNVGTQMLTATAKWVSQHVQLTTRNGGLCG